MFAMGGGDGVIRVFNIMAQVWEIIEKSSIYILQIIIINLDFSLDSFDFIFLISMLLFLIVEKTFIIFNSSSLYNLE